VFVLFVEIPCRVSIEVLPVSVFVARNLGRSPGAANFKDQIELGYRTRHNHHSIDASRLEQGRSALVEPVPLDSRLGVVLAGVVSGRGGLASEIKSWIGRQRRPVERATGATNENVLEGKTLEPLDELMRYWAKDGKTWRMNSPYL
jgi:hypothetical protein